ncbi:hypothetical protein JOE44_004116 [Chryseobacterium sp. PvR013]|uniref:zinc-ribbon domain-containing protein n=1 Tax=Chryseobacterium sp. PvR013 TaxID=2806595 RepID=UPI001AE44B9B|nr:zinc-ribbon domain-containing protein [Chryseobacterium sp. PvR013]MBP1167232.1 hypothetical protein [Chryseobacterium sp. PvR013]
MKYSIEDLKEFALAKNGKCLSNVFLGVEKKYDWKCSEGHIWKASFHKIKNGGNWCPTCALINRARNRIKYTIEDLKDFAIKKEGFCNSEKFINIKSKYKWECINGHIWEAVADNVINSNKWCPFCAGNYIGNILEMDLIAKERNGKCLSSIYKNSSTKLEWQCSEGHRWKAMPSLIKRGAWCPKCSQGIGEKICREYFEQLFETEFEKARPSWLKTENDNLMELDGFSEKLKIAFEHQGEQHYKKINFFYSAKPEKFQQTLNRDKLKLELCSKNNVILIQVPSILEKLGVENLKAFIKDECLKNKIIIPENFDQKIVDLKDVYCPNKLKELSIIAESKKGKLLSKQYLGIFEPLEWQCEKGHKWKAAANNIKNSNSWCPNCLGKNQTIKDMQILANKFEGKCLSEKYINNNTHLLWQCKLGHQFSSKPSNVTTGYWCPICGRNKSGLSRRKYDIEFMHKIAESKNGKCISSEYLGYKIKLNWICENNHQWEATPEKAIRNNKWCKQCKK